jgi:hypothetical protein
MNVSTIVFELCRGFREVYCRIGSTVDRAVPAAIEPRAHVAAAYLPGVGRMECDGPDAATAVAHLKLSLAEASAHLNNPAAANTHPLVCLAPTAAGPDLTTQAIDAFDRFVNQYAPEDLRAHFADNDDNAAEYVRRAIRAAARS